LFFSPQPFILFFLVFQTELGANKKKVLALYFSSFLSWFTYKT